MLNDLRAVVGTQLARWVLEERAKTGKSETYDIMSQLIVGNGLWGQLKLTQPHSYQAQIMLHALEICAPEQRPVLEEHWGVSPHDDAEAQTQTQTQTEWRGRQLKAVLGCERTVRWCDTYETVVIAMFDSLVRLSALGEVLTASECATRYGLTTRAVRYAAEAGRVQARKAADGTWLISRAAAEELWGKRND